MQRVFVLSSDRQPLDPCHPARARQLLKTGHAAVFRHYPFTIILRGRTAAESTTHPHRVKVDPGSKVTGIAVVAEDANAVVWAAELQHRGAQIKARLDTRRALRRARRSRKTRYREPRFDNRRRPTGWLPPSLQSRVENTVTWIARLRRLCPVAVLSVELAKFDTQHLQNPEISGVGYQRGELFGCEVREYLLEKWGRKCVYCGAENVPLQIEHIVPKSRAGTDRVSNLTLACWECNQEKGNRTAAEFGCPEVQAKARRPLKDAAVINATRWALYRRLQETGLPVEVGTGGRTRYNREQAGLPKAHWIDAACVGESGAAINIPEGIKPLLIRARGHGKRQRCGTDRYGFPTRHAPAAKTFMGYRTGDLVRAVVPTGKYAGVHVGRVAIRHRPSFRLNGIDVHPKHMSILQKGDGYEYTQKSTKLPFLSTPERQEHPGRK
jgi:5-methylcytosine-specific restriction endonuclease McrA